MSGLSGMTGWALVGYAHLMEWERIMAHDRGIRFYTCEACGRVNLSYRGDNPVKCVCEGGPK